MNTGGGSPSDPRARRARLLASGVALYYVVLIAVGAWVGWVVGNSGVSAAVGALIACACGMVPFGVLFIVMIRRRKSEGR